VSFRLPLTLPLSPLPLPAACGVRSFAPDEPATGSKSVLAHALVWLADAALCDRLFQRCAHLLPPSLGGGVLAGLNARWRVYRCATSITPMGLRSDSACATPSPCVGVGVLGSAGARALRLFRSAARPHSGVPPGRRQAAPLTTLPYHSLRGRSLFSSASLSSWGIGLAGLVQGCLELRSDQTNLVGRRSL